MSLHSIPRSAGRRVFGDDPAAYASARPQYPEELWAHLASYCGLNHTSMVFEVGAGTGLATRRLLEIPVRQLRAIEPDPRLATYMRATLPAGPLEIVEAPFEEVRMPEAAYDLGVAATSFHWIDPQYGYAKAAAALRPGGRWAMWWTDFAAFREDDPFQAATAPLFEAVPRAASQSRDGGPPYALNHRARIGDMTRAGLIDAEVQTWPSTQSFTTAELKALYRTFSPIRALPQDRQERFLEALGNIADREFDGCVERSFLTVLYTAQKPS